MLCLELLFFVFFFVFVFVFVFVFFVFLFLFPCDAADDELFAKAARLSNHVLHSLSPPSTASQRYDLRQRIHSLQLPEHSTHLSDCNFLMRMLYKNK